MGAGERQERYVRCVQLRRTRSGMGRKYANRGGGGGKRYARLGRGRVMGGGWIRSAQEVRRSKAAGEGAGQKKYVG